jgi:hypothetical protein
MYFDKYVRYLASKNKKSSMRVASQYRKALKLDDLENMGFGTSSGCDYENLKDYPATNNAYSCLSEQFAAHMFTNQVMFNNIMVSSLMKLFHHRASADSSRAGVISMLAMNDNSARISAGKSAIKILKEDKRKLGRFIKALRVDALPTFLAEVKKYLVAGDGYFVFDSVDREMAKISQESKAKADGATNQQKKHKHKLEGVQKKLKHLSGIATLTRIPSDLDKVLETYFLTHGKTLGELFKITDRNMVKIDRNLAQGVQRERVQQLREDHSEDYSSLIGELIYSNETVGRAYRSAILGNFDPVEGEFTDRIFRSIAQDMLPAFRSASRFVDWLDRLLKEKKGSVTLLKSTVSYLEEQGLKEMTEIQVQDFMDEMVL